MNWEGENSPQENNYAENKFKDAINRIKGENIDVAFLPLDSRQGGQYYLGFDYKNRVFEINHENEIFNI